LDKPGELKLDKDDIEQRARLIEEALASYGVEAKVVQINMGPTVTQFGVEPGWDRKYREIKEKGQSRVEEVSKTRVRVERITSLANDLALALAAPSIRIEAPVPGKSMIGIEAPNTVFGSVALRSVVETAAFQKIKARSKLALTLGKGAGGEAVVADLTRMPHLLIAGATGSGKTVCLDSIICCLVLHNSPDDIQFIMIDPKRVELVTFNALPHLAAPVVVDTDKAIKALRWLNQEMDNRYRQFAQVGVRNIEGYNKDRSPGDGLPYLVLVIDELADLIMAAVDEVEHALCRLAQLARATGIHLIVATQRPSVDVVTGLIKSNFPTRISFAVTSQVDSRTILDMVGAEKLLGRGDMLYMPTEAGKPKRLQGSFVSDVEMERLVYFWGNQRRAEVSPVDFDEVAGFPSGQKLAPPPDPLLEEAKRLAQEYKHVSTSFLQRRLRIGYPRAARLMEELEQTGLVEAARPKEER
jgi:S-DNA-T family DNA segregation ATPase FtsK/SpoIIIE